MTEHRDVSHLSLRIEEALPDPEVQADLVEVSVEQSLHLPSMFMIRLYSHDMKWLEKETFREGKQVAIYVGEPPVKLLAGKIAVLEPQLDEADPALVVRGYDLSHKLYRGRHRRSFNQVTDADLVKRLANEAGLKPGTIDSTAEVHEYVFQNNQTNAEFLLERSRRLGYELWVENEQLNFRKPKANEAPVELAWGKNLSSFRPRLSTTQQVNEVEVRGWNPPQKEAVVGRASQGQGAPQIGISESGADVAKEAWGETKLAVVDQFVRSQAEAEALAQATLDELASAFIEAEGSCGADPQITPGRQVQISGVGQRFSGTYYVTRVSHEWSQDSGMSTHFSVSGRRSRDLWSLLEKVAPRPTGLNMVIGVVTNNRDPDELGRVRVRFPWLSDEDESAWARLVSPMAGAGRGLLCIPEVDDEVLVGFEHGDIHRPFVLGALWNGQDKLPISTGQAVGGDGMVNQRVLKSRSGHTITLDDTAGKEEITIIDKTGENKIVFHSPDNSMQIKIQGDLTIEAQGKISLMGTAGVEMSSQAAFSISSQTQLKLEGQASVDVKASGPVSVSGTPIKLN